MKGDIDKLTDNRFDRKRDGQRLVADGETHSEREVGGGGLLDASRGRGSERERYWKGERKTVKRGERERGGGKRER